MPPAKPRNGHDESNRSDAAHGNSKDGHSKERDTLNTPSSQAAGGGSKMRRVASAAGSNLRESAANTTSLDAGHSSSAQANGLSAAKNAATGLPQDSNGAGGALQWSSFDRSFLHSYRRAHRLSTPTSFISEYHRWVLARPGSIGLQSPTMLRTKIFRRQSKDNVSAAVRKHFNSQAIQENDVVVDFLHKVGTTSSAPIVGVPKPNRTRRKD